MRLLIKLFQVLIKELFKQLKGFATHFQLNIEIMDDLKERRLSEYPVPDFQDAMNQAWDNPHYALEGGESNMRTKKED